MEMTAPKPATTVTLSKPTCHHMMLMLTAFLQKSAATDPPHPSPHRFFNTHTPEAWTNWFFSKGLDAESITHRQNRGGREAGERWGGTGGGRGGRGGFPTNAQTEVQTCNPIYLKSCGFTTRPQTIPNDLGCSQSQN